MKMKIFLMTFCMLCAENVMADNGLFFGVNASYYDQSEVKKALSYRKDINKDVLKLTKGWSSKPVAHSDWIENAGGKSIDVEGNVLFPDIDYQRIYEWFPHLYIVANSSTHKAGLVHRSGTVIIPMVYDDVEETLTSPAAVFIGKKNDGTTDIFNQQGVLLCSIFNPSYVWTQYEEAARVIVISYTKTGDDETKCFQFFWRDGTKACDDQIGKSVIAIENEVSIFTGNGIINVNLNRSSKEQIDMRLENEILAGELLKSNTWLALATEYFEMGKFAQAYDCLKYYEMFDNLFSLTIGTSVGPILTQMQMNCLYQTKNYEKLIVGVTGTTRQKLNINFDATLKGLEFDQATGCFKFTEHIYPKEALPLIQQCADACTQLYQSSLPAYQNQLERQRQNELLWNTLWTRLDNSLQQSTSGLFQSDLSRMQIGVGTSSSGTSASAVVPAVSASNADSAVSSSSESVKKKPCKICKGTGREVHETYMGSIASGKEKWCSECGKNVYMGHGHRTCTLCHGSGLY